MPEMLQCCGKQLRVLNRVVQATIDGAFLVHHAESFVREFRNNDVVILQGVRCSGAKHDGCQRGCAIFWKEAWLERVNDGEVDRIPKQDFVNATTDKVCSNLKTKTESSKYFCQSSEFLKATLHLSNMQRIKKCFSAVAAGNITVWGMLKRIFVWMWCKTRTRLVGEHVQGSLEKTPTEFLGLKPGELVEVRSSREILTTLNKDGRNRGLHFSAEQRPF
jgi:hypothetical protein